MKNSKNPKDYHHSVLEKFAVMWKMLPDLITIYIAWFSEYLIYVSVVTTLAFPNAPFSARDHYKYYIFALSGGEVVGRSYLAILSYIKADCAENATPSSMSFGDHPSFSPSILYHGCLVPFFTQYLDHFIVVVFLRSRVRCFLRQCSSVFQSKV